jgi:cytochrome oxidase Cu insertion factor (SCO1/SenC/PrrC family)
MSLDTEKQKRSRRQMILMALAFAAPLVIASALYYSGWRPDAVHPHGELVIPARPVADVELNVLDGKPLRFSSLQKRWLFVYFGSSECTATCEHALYVMRQVIAAQGREAYRVRAAMVVTDRRALEMLHYQLKDYPDMTTLLGNAEAIARLAREFEVPAGGALAGLHRIYVVDPLGNFMMSYPADADPSGVSKDLTKLLRLSQIG